MSGIKDRVKNKHAAMKSKSAKAERVPEPEYDEEEVLEGELEF